MPKCKVCDLDVAKLIDCHVYPQSMSKEAAGEDRALIAMSITDGPRASYSTKGLFDPNLACASCESLFGKADNYAIVFRRKALSLSLPTVRWGTAASPTFLADPAALHSFAMNTLLRAHLSDRWELKGLKDEELAQEALLALHSGTSTIGGGREISLILTRSPLASLLATPHRRQIGDLPIYVIQLPNMLFLVAASTGGLGPGFSDIALRPGAEVTVWRRRKPLPVELLDVANAFEVLGDRVDRMAGRL